MGAKTSDGPGQLLIGGGQVAAAGDTVLITPPSGRALRIYYVSYNPAAASEVGFKFGATGTVWLRNNLVANSVIAKDFKDLKYIQGAIDEVLSITQTNAVIVDWTVFYVLV